MKCDNQSELLLFPTPIWEFRYSDCEAFNQKLAEDILAFDWKSYKEEHNLNFGDDLNSRTEDTFIPVDQAISVMHVLQQALEKATEIAPRLGWDLERHNLQLCQYWANVNAPFEYNMRHNHAPNHLSGVYYVRVPENSGNIRFFDERRTKTVTEPDDAFPTDLSNSSHTFNPVEGMLLLFPSWLDHLVGQNRSDEPRVSISFNIDVVAKPAEQLSA